MKKLIGVLILVALFFIVPGAATYNETEFEAFADGVVAAIDSRAQWVVNNGSIIVLRPATNFEREDMDYAINRAKELAVAANTISIRFPGEFDQASGSLSIGSQPYVGVIIFNVA